jgi:hypothetical protein
LIKRYPDQQTKQSKVNIKDNVTLNIRIRK